MLTFDRSPSPPRGADDAAAEGHATGNEAGASAAVAQHTSTNIDKLRDAVGAVQQLHRITVRVDDASFKHIHSIHKDNSILASYDLVAVEVLTEEAWGVVVDSGAVDIITLPMGERLPFALSRRHMDKLHAAGMCLEIVYAPALQHGTVKRFFAANVSDVHRQLRGRFARGGVLLSSAAPSHQLMRAPHDAAAFVAGITGIPRSSVLPCLSKAPLRALQHAASRQATNGVTVLVQGKAVTPSSVHAEITTEEQVYAAAAPAAAGAGAAPGTAASAAQLVSDAASAAVASSRAAKRKKRRSKKRAGESPVLSMGPSRGQVAGAAQDAMASALGNSTAGGAAATVGGGALTLGERAKRARVGM